VLTLQRKKAIDGTKKPGNNREKKEGLGTATKLGPEKKQTGKRGGETSSLKKGIRGREAILKNVGQKKVV